MPIVQVIQANFLCSTLRRSLNIEILNSGIFNLCVTILCRDVLLKETSLRALVR